MGGTYGRKWCRNHNSNNSESIHPLVDVPYTVPSTSPSVISSLINFRSNITYGGSGYPPAEQHMSTVIWDLFPALVEYGCLSSLTVTTFGGLGDSGMPVLSQFRIWHGLSMRSFSTSLLQNVVISIQYNWIAGYCTCICKGLCRPEGDSLDGAA